MSEEEVAALRSWGAAVGAFEEGAAGGGGVFVHRSTVAAFQFDIPWLCMPRSVCIDPALRPLSDCCRRQRRPDVLPFGCTRCRQSYTGVGIVGLLRLHVEEMRRLKVAVPLRYIAEIIE